MRTSRWRAGPTSFGPVGRIVSTLVLAALFPWWGIAGLNPLALWAMMGWLIAAAIVLRSIWKPERIVDDGPSRGIGSGRAIRCSARRCGWRDPRRS